MLNSRIGLQNRHPAHGEMGPGRILSSCGDRCHRSRVPSPVQGCPFSPNRTTASAVPLAVEFRWLGCVESDTYTRAHRAGAPEFAQAILSAVATVRGFTELAAP